MPANAHEVETRSAAESRASAADEGHVLPHGAPRGQVDGSTRFDTWFPVAWWTFRILVWATAAVFLEPRWLEQVGGDDVARWLGRNAWFRWLSVPILGPMLAFSAFELRGTGRERAARAGLAAAVGGTLVKTPRVDPVLGLPEGPALRVPLGPWSMVVATWVRKRARRTMARVTVRVASSFSFLARSARSESAMLRGLQQGVVTMQLQRWAGDDGDPRRAVTWPTLAYLGEAPMRIGHAELDRTVVLRANQAETARGMLALAAVPPALAAFESLSRSWEWSLQPTERPGQAEMRFECSGGELDAERVRVLQELMGAALEYLAENGTIER